MVKSNFLVSIIVPIYGTEAYLPKCIESALAQSYSHIQLILVDDQSPDKCPEICDEYAKKDDRITVIHQINGGVSAARNKGLQYALGEYIMFLDSDDELLPGAVEMLLADACEHNADIVSANVKAVDVNGEAVDFNEDGRCMCYQNDETIRLLLNEDLRFHAVYAKLFKTSFIKNIRFEEGKNIGEDGFFMFQCVIQNPRPMFVQHDVIVYQQNIRPGSSSKLVFSDKTLSMLYFFEKKKAYVTENLPQYVDDLHQAEVCVHLRLLDALCSTNEKKYTHIRKRCIKTVCDLHSYYQPINEHHRLLLWVVSHHLYYIYRFFVRMKYYR